MHALGQRAGLAVAGAAGHDHAVEEGGDVGGVEDLDILGFYIFQGIHYKELQAGEISVQGVAPNKWMLNRVGLASRNARGPAPRLTRCSYFTECQSLSIKTLSIYLPLPSMLISMLLALKVPVNCSLVNWARWSVLKISGLPNFAIALSR
jgi:hypothetical protein